MIDLGTLGGTYGGPGANLGLDTNLAMNNRGQVVGASTLAGDLVAHPFLWNHGVLLDLGTLGGDNGSANWINEAGDVVGEADLPGSVVHHAFLWRNGEITDLGTLGSTSFAEAVNSSGQVVGRSRTGSPTSSLQHAFLWEHGGPMIDLNTLMPASSDVLLTDACCITEDGEIVATGTLATGDVRTILLIPCEEGTAACGDAAEAAVSTTHNNLMPPLNRSTTSTTRPMPSETTVTWRARWALRYKLPGLTTPKD